MAKPRKKITHEPAPLTGLERLGLRVSNMINHPIAQQQRWVEVHRLDTDGDREWEEVMGLLAETDGLDMTFKDDGAVLLEWEAQEDDDLAVEDETELRTVEDVAPF